ncbi:MAG: hypothetical protein RLZZ628_70 [Bacteroidota bacterium]|jgi:hypothetical protein
MDTIAHYLSIFLPQMNPSYLRIRLRHVSFFIFLCFSVEAVSQSGSFGNLFVHAQGEMAIHGVHQFGNGATGVLPGIIGTERVGANSIVSFVGSATGTGASNTTHIDGYVRKYGIGAFTFPIGDNGKYRPCSISSMANAAEMTTAAYFNADPNTAITSNLAGGNYGALPTGAPFNPNLKASDVQTVGNIEYWDINGVAAVQLTLSYDATSAIAALTNNDLSKLTIVGWNGTQWISIPSTATGSVTSGTIKTNAAITPNAYNVYTFAATATNVVVAPKAFLSGAYVSATGMMYDSLRVKGFIPSAQPYNSMGYAGAETVIPSVLATTGANAIVDWVLIQLRSDTSTVVAQQAALIQRDGDIVSTDGISPLTFAGVTAGNYYVVVKHRNHLGVMTANAIALTSAATTVDFTGAATPNYQIAGNFGTVYAQRTIGAVRTLWSGNTGGGNAVKATGASSDAEAVLFKVLLDAGNADLLPTFILYNGYFREDGNLDGNVIYQGSGSEFDLMLFNVLLHGNNSFVLPNFIIYEQIP